MATILHEYVNDWSTRTRLADSWGFCRRHAWSFLSLEWGRFRDGMNSPSGPPAVALATRPMPSRRRRAQAPRPQRGGSRHRPWAWMPRAVLNLAR